MSLFKKPVDFLAIGDIAVDAFIKLKDAHINCKLNNEDCEICMKFGEKIPYELDAIIRGVGNAANAAVAAARLGLSSAIISNVGKDERGKECIEQLKKNGVSTDYVYTEAGKKTNYHYVLWYGTERTILVKHENFVYSLPIRPGRTPPKWIYLSSLSAEAENASDFYDKITDYLEKTPSVKLAFQPGTFQIEQGIDRLKKVYAKTEVFAANIEEAQRVLGTDESDRDIKSLCGRLTAMGPKIILLTDGPIGAYLFDNDRLYMIPPYPDPKPPYERTGAGDAFSATFVAALAIGKTPIEAFTWAPINSASVVQYIGSQQGLLTREKLEEWLAKAPADYGPTEI